jgi:hypothetical protein
VLKIKFNGIRPEVESLIKKVAEDLQLYTPGFPDESQGSGYHAFKEMCLVKEEICTYDEFEAFRTGHSPSNEAPIGFYLLTRLHPNARDITLDAVNTVRKILRDRNVSKVEILKKK